MKNMGNRDFSKGKRAITHNPIILLNLWGLCYSLSMHEYFNIVLFS